MSLKEIT